MQEDRRNHTPYILRSSSHRLCVLAAALCISPSKLRRYIMEVQRRGARETTQHHDSDLNNNSNNNNNSNSNKNYHYCHHDSNNHTTSTIDSTGVDNMEPTQEFPPLLHAILCVLILPFTGGDNVIIGNSNLNSNTAVSGTSSSSFTSTTNRVAAAVAAVVMKDNESKRTSRDNNSGGNKTNLISGSSVGSSAKEVSAGRSELRNMQEHFASLRDNNLTLHRVDENMKQQQEEEIRNRNGISMSSSSNSNSSDSDSYSDNDDKDNNSNSDSSEEKGVFTAEISPIVKKVNKKEKQNISTAAEAKKKKRHHYHKMIHSCEVGWATDEVSLSQLLTELAHPVLTARAHYMAAGNHNTTETDSRLESQQSMQLLPRELHTSAGVARLIALYPPFIPLLLEALLKECLHGDILGFAARRVVMRLTELAAPSFVSRHVRRTPQTPPSHNDLNSGDVHEEKRGDNNTDSNNMDSNTITITNNTITSSEETFYHAMLLRATTRLSNTAVSVLQMIEDPVWALTLCNSLISSQLLHPTSLLDVLHRRGLDLAKTPALWKPAVALAYAIVTHHSLRDSELAVEVDVEVEVEERENKEEKEEENEEEEEEYHVEKEITDVPTPPDEMQTTITTTTTIAALSTLSTLAPLAGVQGRSEGVHPAEPGPPSPLSDLTIMLPSVHKNISQQEHHHQRSSVLHDVLNSARSRSAVSLLEAASGTTGSAAWISVASMGRAASLSSSFRLPLDHQQQQQQQQRHYLSNSEMGNHSTLLQWRFPDKVPPVITMSNAIVMTCMILCAGPLGKHTVVTLCQWCLRSLAILPSTPCAVGLTHLMMKYPHYLEKVSVRPFSLPQGSHNSSSSTTTSSSSNTAAAAIAIATASSSSVSGHNPMPFCSAVFSEACRLARVVVQQQSKIRNDGRLTLVWQKDGKSTMTDASSYHHDNNNNSNIYEEASNVREDPALRELYELQCYLVMMLQALVMRQGIQLSVEAQEELVSLFVSIARLRVMVGAEIPRENTWGSDNDAELQECVGNNTTSTSNTNIITITTTTLPQLIITLVDDAFRAVARAVDIVLHDYDAGCPRQLCEALVLLLPPKSDLFAELDRVGAWEKHLDCLETVQAAAEAYKEALRSVSARGSASRTRVQKEKEKEKEQKEEEVYKDTILSNTICQGKSIPRASSLLSLQEELAAETQRVIVEAASRRSGAEVMFGSLIGVLPCSGEPLRLSAANSNNNNNNNNNNNDNCGGGLTRSQKQWWLQHMMIYLVEEWWKSRVAVQVQFQPFADGDESEGGVFISNSDQRGFLQCCANPI